jgi:hypothetical protein
MMQFFLLLAERTVASEIDDPNNDGNFSENAWDNYQVILSVFGKLFIHY